MLPCSNPVGMLHQDTAYTCSIRSFRCGECSMMRTFQERFGEASVSGTIIRMTVTRADIITDVLSKELLHYGSEATGAGGSL